MQPKPEAFGSQYAETFKGQQVVDAYRHRPPYPEEVFDILTQLITDEPRTILDVGAGSGDIARHCISFAQRIDAVDFSQSMIARGKQLPDGEHPHLHWIHGKVCEGQKQEVQEDYRPPDWVLLGLCPSLSLPLSRRRRAGGIHSIEA